METISPAPIHSTTTNRNMPSRSQSTRIPASTSTPHRSASVTNHRASERPLDSIAKRDGETTNLARPSRSSTGKDRNPPDRSESTRANHHKSSSRTRESRHQQEMSGNTSVAQGSGPAPVVAPPESKHGSSKTGRSRTTITTQTGNWVLGKTIGAGSMGKVKLAKRVEGGEQVNELLLHAICLILMFNRSLSKSFLDCLLTTKIKAEQIANEQIIRKKFEQHGRQP